ncbi:MAG: phospho-N-acetylmuramoyl-pentapeptide-transferase [Clostridia bacterium]|nr:phospho-N-acetylmuramoyl-pentapeptide-transferase [Clostridia bacterium]
MNVFFDKAEELFGNIWFGFIPFLISFAVTVLIIPMLIPYLKKLKFGQEILEIGPKWHKSKEGTPTMGGISFILGTLAAGLVMLFAKFDLRLLMMLVISLGFGLIGFTDDYIKVVKKRNLGLTARQKFLLQIILAVIYVIVLQRTGNLDTHIVIPFCKKAFELNRVLYVILIMFVVAGTVNAVNLTDGIDGLASSITAVVLLFFAVVSVFLKDLGGAWYVVAVLGGCLAFLIFNKYPARLFMGDTGSLFLGGSLSVIAVGLKMPLILIIVGFVYLFETLSVIIQVTSFKLTGKRVFKMTPIHHHFEMCGWKEKKIVGVFTAVTVILCIVGAFSAMPYILGI